MTGGLEIRVLDGAKTWSVVDTGCESFLEGSVALDSWMGTAHGICPWDNSLEMRKFDGGGIWGGLWMVFLWGPFEGGDGEETTSGHVQQGRFRWTTRVCQTAPFFMLYVIY